jgi:hypothetical protein
VYCCVVLDTFSRKVVGWSIDSTQTTSLVLNALGMATQRRPDRDGLVMHSDRGVQFTSWAVSHNLTQAGISPSMGAVGSAYDNALMESFWGRMQVELLDRRKWKTRIELATAILDYIELWHNPRRRHSALQMRTPDEVETAWPSGQHGHDRYWPMLRARAAAGASARLRRAPAPTAEATPHDRAVPPSQSPTRQTSPPDSSVATPPKQGQITVSVETSLSQAPCTQTPGLREDATTQNTREPPSPSQTH